MRTRIIRIRDKADVGGRDARTAFRFRQIIKTPVVDAHPLVDESGGGRHFPGHPGGVFPADRTDKQRRQVDALSGDRIAGSAEPEVQLTEIQRTAAFVEINVEETGETGPAHECTKPSKQVLKAVRRHDFPGTGDAEMPPAVFRKHDDAGNDDFRPAGTPQHGIFRTDGHKPFDQHRRRAVRGRFGQCPMQRRRIVAAMQCLSTVDGLHRLGETGIRNPFRQGEALRRYRNHHRIGHRQPDFAGQ